MRSDTEDMEESGKRGGGSKGGNKKAMGPKGPHRREGKWLGSRDSNPGCLIQSQVSYR